MKALETLVCISAPHVVKSLFSAATGMYLPQVRFSSFPSPLAILSYCPFCLPLSPSYRSVPSFRPLLPSRRSVPSLRPLLSSLRTVPSCHPPCRPSSHPLFLSPLPVPYCCPLLPSLTAIRQSLSRPPLTSPLPDPHRAIWIYNLPLAPQYTVRQAHLALSSPLTRWIYNPRPAPQYTAESCTSLGRNLACQRNGRPDSEYEKYTWRSFGCTIADFKPLSFLTLLRNKVFLVVGDSLTMNLFSSLQCLVETVTLTEGVEGPLFPGGPKTHGIYVPAFNATLLRHPSSFLTNSTPEGDRSSASTWTVHLDQVNPDWSPLLQYSHYALFGTGTWYTMADPKKRHYMINNTLQPEMDRIVTMQLAINTVRKFTRSLKYTGMPMFLTFTPMHYDVRLNESMQHANCSVIQRPLTIEQVANMDWAVDAVKTRKAQLK
ncbi:unnamed protein product, partial [Closterium sp. NIES-54]